MYNIGGGNEVTNLEITRRILSLVDRPDSLIRHVPDRQGHDRRYCLDTVAAAGARLGARRQTSSAACEQTVEWYAANEWWWRPIKEQDPAFRAYYQQQYGTALS